MKARLQVDEVSSSLETRLATGIDILLNKISGQPLTKEIEAEVETLLELVNDFSQRDRLLEKLLDLTTPTAEVRQIIEQLPDSAKRVAENREDLQHLHSVSHQLIERSVRLVTTAQRLIHQSKNQSSRYALEVCGFCEGFGRTRDGSCEACQGERNVLVRQPALKCPRCHGTGKPDRPDPSVKCYGRCTVCLGSGWAFRMAERHRTRV